MLSEKYSAAYTVVPDTANPRGPRPESFILRRSLRRNPKSGGAMQVPQDTPLYGPRSACATLSSLA